MRCLQRIAVWLTLLCCSVGRAAAQPSPNLPPDATVTSFYSWYLHELALRHDPLSRDGMKMSVYVSPTLLRTIRQRMQSAEGLDADYFLQAQDYLDSWLDHIQASRTSVLGTRASTVVTLGNKPAERYQLKISMVREQGAWKIEHVGRLRPLP